MKKLFTCLAALFTSVLALQTAGADLTQPTGNAQEENPLGMLVSHTVPGSYQAGQPIEIMITIRFVSAAEGVTALGFTEEIPPGWMFQSMGNLVAGLMPTITPQPGAQEQLGFAWITIPPEFPYQFTYFLMPAEDAAGQQTISGQGEYRLSAGRQLSDIDIVVLNGKDSTPPRITLLGENPMTIEEGSPYVEPGYTATDNVDGDVTNRVQVSGQVNSQAAGTYTLTYSVSDTAGNAATPVIRSVIVVEPADDGNHGGVPSGSAAPRPRTRRGGYGGYGYYPGQDYVDPVTQQPVDPNAAQQEQAQPLAMKANPPQPGTPPSQMYARGNAASSNTALSGEGGLISPGDMKINWPTPGEENADASKAEPGPNVAKPNAPSESVTATAAPATAAAPETATATALAAAPAAKAENTGVVAAAPAAAANTGAVAATMPPVPPPPKPGLFESMSAAISKMQTADWLRLGIVMAVLAIIGVLAGIAWRGAYSPPPRRKTSNGARS